MIKDLVLQIPENERLEILRFNRIASAVQIASDYNMKCLVIVWKQYIEPNVDLYCQLCYKRILDNFRAMQPIMIELAKESNLYASI